MKPTRGAWGTAEKIAAMTLLVAIIGVLAGGLAIPGMPKLFHWDVPDRSQASDAPPKELAGAPAEARSPSVNTKQSPDNRVTLPADPLLSSMLPTASFTQAEFPLTISEAFQDGLDEGYEGRQQMVKSLLLTISVDGIFDHPAFDVQCSSACFMDKPFIDPKSDTNGELRDSLHLVDVDLAKDMTNHRISFRERLPPSEVILLRVRFERKFGEVLSVVSSQPLR